jgi:hypothetical protein
MLRMFIDHTGFYPCRVRLVGAAQSFLSKDRPNGIAYVSESGDQIELCFNTEADLIQGCLEGWTKECLRQIRVEVPGKGVFIISAAEIIQHQEAGTSELIKLATDPQPVARQGRLL